MTNQGHRAFGRDKVLELRYMELSNLWQGLIQVNEPRAIIGSKRRRSDERMS